MFKQRPPLTFKKYVLTFFIVAIIFTLGFLTSDYLNDKRFLEINRAREEFQIQIMGLETQLAHFKDILCPDIGDDILTHELHVIGEKLQFMKNDLGVDHPEVLHLRKHYSLLQVRHHQFSKELNQRCNLGLIHILYFYADNRACPKCEKQGYILTHLRKNHPHLRIYSFDYNLELPALAVVKPIIPPKYLEETPKNRNNRIVSSVQKEYLPIIVINEKPFFGFQDLDAMKGILEIE